MEHCGAVSAGQADGAVHIDSCTGNGIGGAFGIILDGKGHSLVGVGGRGVNVGKGHVDAVLVHAGGGVRHGPAHAEGNAQGNHVLLGQVEDDGLGAGVLDHGLVQDLDVHILADGVHQLLEVAGHHAGNAGIKAAVLREVDRRAVQGIGGGALHIALVQGVAVGVLDAAQGRFGAHGSHNAVHGVACILHLGKQSVFAQQGIIADAAGNVVAGLAGNGDNVVLPLCRAVDAEQNGLVHPQADGFVDTRGHLAQNVKLSIGQNGFGDGDNDCQLTGGQVDVFPRLAGSLLIAGITVDPVGQRQHGKHRNAGLLAGHVGQLAAQLHHNALLGGILKNGADNLLTDEGFSAGTINNIGHGLFSFHLPNAARIAAFASSRPVAAAGVPVALATMRAGLVSAANAPGSFSR